MKTCKYKTGFTLVEMVVVIAIVAVLATMVVGIAAHIDSKKDQKRARRTIVLLSTALGQFHDYGFDYKHPDYSAFGFPLDCNDFSPGELESALKDALGYGDVQIIGAVDANDSGNEVMYLLLSMVPASRKTLDKIDRKLITNLGFDRQPMEITMGSGEDAKRHPLLRVTDPWGTTLRYDYYDEKTGPPPDPKTKKTFPVIISAGPDRLFGTDDDITNR